MSLNFSFRRALLSFSGVSNRNPEDDYELLGMGDGSGTSLTSNSSINVLATGWTSIGTPSGDYAGGELMLGIASSSTRFGVQLRVNGVILPDIFYHHGGVVGINSIPVSINIASGSLIEARCQATSSSSVVRAMFRGRLRNANSPPMYGAYRAPTFVSASTLPGGVDITSGVTPAWAELIASTAEAYGAFFAVMGYNPSSIPATTAQGLTAQFGYGATTSGGTPTKIIGDLPFYIHTTDPRVPRSVSRVFQHSIPAGTRISCRIYAPAGTDVYRPGFYGLTPP